MAQFHRLPSIKVKPGDVLQVGKQKLGKVPKAPADGEELVYQLSMTVEGAAPPVEPPPVEPPPVKPPKPTVPPEPKPPATGDDVQGGPPGANGRTIVANKKFGQLNLASLEPGTDLVNPVLSGPIWSPAQGANTDIRIFNGKMQGVKSGEGNHGPILFYVNDGHHPRRSGLVVINFTFEGCEAQVGLELKCYGYVLRNIVFKDCKSLDKPMRMRIGDWNLVQNVTGITGKFGCRCENNFLQNIPGGDILFYAGNLPADYASWIKLHQAGTRKNMEASAKCYAGNVRSVYAGVVSDPKLDNKYPALRCTVEPGLRMIPMNHKDTQVAKMDFGTWAKRRNEAVSKWKQERVA